MSVNMWVRTVHRWLSVIFTAAVVVNIVALVMKSQAMWVGFLALVPLIPMLITGVYLFALPYVAKSRRSKA